MKNAAFARTFLRRTALGGLGRTPAQAAWGTDRGGGVGGCWRGQPRGSRPVSKAMSGPPSKEGKAGPASAALEAQ